MCRLTRDGTFDSSFQMFKLKNKLKLHCLATTPHSNSFISKDPLNGKNLGEKVNG